MGSAAGARRTAATRIGVTLAEYDARLLAGEKWCGSCRTWHGRGRFELDRSRTDGLSAVCAAARIRCVDRPGKAERRAARARGHAWCRDCVAWLPLSAVNGGRCQEHRNADYRARYAHDGEAIRQRVYARKRRLEPIPGWWVGDQRERFGGLCAYGCGRSAGSSDHIWPVARGGTSRPGNLVPACVSCNSSKGDGDPAPWIRRGFEAFPAEWADKWALAVEHGSDQWVEHFTEVAS